MDARIQDTKKHQLSALHHTSIRVGHGGIDRGVGWFHELFVRTVSETVNIGSFFFSGGELRAEQPQRETRRARDRADSSSSRSGRQRRTDSSGVRPF